MPSEAPSPGLAEGQAGLSTARGEAVCFIRLKCYAITYGMLFVMVFAGIVSTPRGQKT